MPEHDYRASVLRKVELDKFKVKNSGHKPQIADVIAVRVRELNESYRQLDLEGGELVELEEGDVVLGVLGNRAGVKGYVGGVPSELDQGDDLSFLGSGGIFGRFSSATEELDDPCKVEFLGYVETEDEIVNTKNYGIEASQEVEVDAKLVPVIATRMDVGKTTLAKKLIEEMDSRGYSVASLKLTGSARERDRVEMLEKGSERSMDFVDAGLPSTVCDSEDVVMAAKGLVNEVWNDDLDFIVVELGAGLVSKYNVESVMRNMEIRKRVESLCTVSLDVPGALGLKELLSDMEYELSLVSGPITDTDVGKETVENRIGVEALNALREEELELIADKVEKDIQE